MGLGTSAKYKGTPAYNRKKRRQAAAAAAKAATEMSSLVGRMGEEARGHKQIEHEEYGGEFGKQVTEVYQKPSLQHLSKVGPMMTGPKYSRYFAVTTTPTGREVQALYDRRAKGGAFRGDYGELGFATPKGSYTYDGTTRTIAEWEAIEPNWTAGHAVGDKAQNWVCPPSDPECRYLKWYKSKFR